MSRSQVCKTKTEYLIVTFSESDIGLYIIDDPIYHLPLGCAPEEIETAVVDSLLKSRRNVPTPKREEWASWQKDMLKKMKQKSFTSLVKDSISCRLIEKEGSLYIYP